MLLALSMSAAMAAPASADCDLTEADYRELRKELKTLRRAQPEAIAVAGQGDRCSQALQDVVRNDPLLGIHRVEASGNAHLAVQDTHAKCGAVLTGGQDGYALVPVGRCEPVVPTTRRIVSAGYWAPGGLSLRWNEDLFAGLSGILDVSTQLDASNWDDPSWRALGGLDIGQGPLKTDNFLGFRLGAQQLATPAIDERDFVAQFVVGRKWIGGALALQVGGGVMALVPLNQGIQHETLHPVLEVRGGLAPRR